MNETNIDSKLTFGKVTYEWFQLTETIKNPEPDRRCRHDWRAEQEFPAGLRLVRETFQDAYGIKGVPSIELRPSTGSIRLGFGKSAKGFAALMTKLTPVNPTLIELRQTLSVPTVAVLDELVASGAVSEETVSDATLRIARRDREELEKETSHED